MIENDSQLIYVEITDEMLKQATIDSDSYKDNLNNSIRYGQGTLAGCLGEEMFKKVFPFMTRVNDYNYDFTYTSQGDHILTFDIKTKERTVPPELYYDCSVNNMNGKQDVDYYIFAQVMDDYRRGWLLGMKRTDRFFKEAVLHPKGSRDPSNNFKFHCDTYNVPINQLRPIQAPEGWIK